MLQRATAPHFCISAFVLRFPRDAGDFGCLDNGAFVPHLFMTAAHLLRSGDGTTRRTVTAADDRFTINERIGDAKVRQVKERRAVRRHGPTDGGCAT
ncbi:MAG TPA: hypothetical protein VD767_09715 [Thermomicrobiales bacterium]|nr:hypothetical protein [Thermomicrobiales bacterium]